MPVNLEMDLFREISSYLSSLDSRRLGAGDSKNDLFFFFLNFFFSLLFLNQGKITNNLLFLPLCAGPVKPTIFPLFWNISAGFRWLKKKKKKQKKNNAAQ